MSEVIRSAQHWLMFNDRREIVGCHCGFAADMDSDCGWGDSVVAHLLGSRQAAEAIAHEHAASVDAEHGCCHDEEALRNGGRACEWEDGAFEPLPHDCPGKATLDRHLAALADAPAVAPVGRLVHCAADGKLRWKTHLQPGGTLIPTEGYDDTCLTHGRALRPDGECSSCLYHYRGEPGCRATTAGPLESPNCWCPRDAGK